MNRTHIEGAAGTLAEKLGYTFYTGQEEAMTHTIGRYPAAWLAPLELNSAEGKRHGRETYDVKFHLLRKGVRLNEEQRRKAVAEMEEEMLAIFTELSSDHRILAVEKLSIKPHIYSLTPHGEISQTATARIVTWF